MNLKQRQLYALRRCKKEAWLEQETRAMCLHFQDAYERFAEQVLLNVLFECDPATQEDCDTRSETPQAP